jgi:membrane-bound lytic murein transglycosylase F
MSYFFIFGRVTRVSLPLIILFSLISCSDRQNESNRTIGDEASRYLETDSIDILLDQMVDFDFDQIKKRGSIKIALENNSTGYFLYKGRPMGFHYELVKSFCDANNLRLETILENDFYKSFQYLLSGEIDLIAHSFTITRYRKEYMEFTKPLYEVRQMLVQRKPEAWKKMKRHQIENQLLKSPSELIGKKIHVRRASSYFSRLQNLSEEIGGEIHIIAEDGETTTEDLIVMVANGTIDYTVSDEDIAKVGATYFDNIDVNTPVSLPTQVGWIIRKNSSQLQDHLNAWFQKIKSKPDFNVVFKRYFEDPKNFKKRARSDFSTILGSNISPYDEIIKKYATSIGWDWRLLAALIYQESQFNPEASSWVGAKGLMQVMPVTAAEFGAQKILDPEQNIMAGTGFIEWLIEYWQNYIDDENEIYKFVIASYNTGQGHVFDAMRLAGKYGKDSLRWDENVAFYLELKSKPKYYKDPVVQFGYCRGREPVEYVESISEQYEIYKQFFD